MQIELASESDAETLARLRRRVHGLHVSHVPQVFVQPTDAEATALFRELLVQHNAWAFLAYADDEPVGYLLALLQERQASPLTRARRWLYVDQISVEPAWERRGVGRQLLQKAIDLGRSLGISELITDVWTFNGKAKAFFETCGFQLQMERFSMHLGE